MHEKARDFPPSGQICWKGPWYPHDPSAGPFSGKVDCAGGGADGGGGGAREWGAVVGAGEKAGNVERRSVRV